MLHPDTLFYPLDPSEPDLLMDMLSGTIIGVKLGSDDGSDDCHAIALRMSDGRTIYLGISDGVFIVAEEGLGEA